MRTVIRRAIFLTVIALVVYGVLLRISPNAAQKAEERIAWLDIPFTTKTSSNTAIKELLQKEADEIEASQEDNQDAKTFKGTISLSWSVESGTIKWVMEKDSREKESNDAVPINSYAENQTKNTKLSEEDKKKIEEMIYSLIK